MREIRFRAKRQDNGEWIKSGTMVTFNIGDTVKHYIPDMPSETHIFTDSEGNIRELDADICLVKSDTIGQFIGEQDAEGNDIYEGDIVQHGEKRYVIRYIDHYARFAGKNKRCIFAVFPFGNCTILGNIHDQPYLMEAAE